MINQQNFKQNNCESEADELKSSKTITYWLTTVAYNFITFDNDISNIKQQRKHKKNQILRK